MQLPKFYRNLRVQTAIKSLIAELETKEVERIEAFKKYKKGKEEVGWFGIKSWVVPDEMDIWRYAASHPSYGDDIVQLTKKLKALETFPDSSRIGLTVQEVHGLFSGRSS